MMEGQDEAPIAEELPPNDQYELVQELREESRLQWHPTVHGFLH
jgi:hypothetical protein